MYEVIEFKSFIAGSVYPSFPVNTWLDGGYTFFLSTGAVLLTLVVLEKMGVEINESLVRIVGVCGVLLALGWAIFKNPLFRRLLIGF
jgi:hypothetical protein